MSSPVPQTFSQAETLGLSDEEAATRRLVHGDNRVVVRAPTPVWRRVVDQLRDPMILVLLAAAALTVATGDLKDAVIIAVVVVVNTAVGVIQEVRAGEAVAALSALTAPTARVRRDGVSQTLPADALVPGDVVELAEGDIVPADCELLESAALLVDEAAVTGESVPVEKARRLGTPDPVEEGRLSAGTVVVRGRAVALVTATGPGSAMGRIAQLMDTGTTTTPLQRRLAGLGRLLAIGAGGLCLVVAVLGLLGGQPLEVMAVTAISLVVAAVPESLPAVVTLSLALGAKRMAARQAIVRRLAAVETLGSVTILATDKTGTLTEGRMVAEVLWTPAGEATVTGTGYAPEGEIRGADAVPTAATGAAYIDLLAAAVLCNDATLEPPSVPGGDWRAVGDPTEAALLAVAGKLGTDPVAGLGAQRVDELPFDSLRRRMTTLHRQGDGRWLVTCKGAPEVILLSSVVTADPTVLAQAVTRARELGAAGYRVLAMARALLDDRPTELLAAEAGLELLGLVAIADPPRPGAAETIASCRRAGIVPILITGDHPSTARAIAERLGILLPGEVVDGEGREVADACAASDLAAGSGPSFAADPAAGQVRVYARSTPEQKMAVIGAWQDAGQVVAMTGDGVNDGPAMRRADIGIAMGGRGTEVARQAADLVLADDNLATVVTAVEEGRRVYANVRRFLLYGLAGGTAEILVMLLGPFLGLALPLTPAQILWVNLMTHGLPGVALGAEPADPDSMAQPPRSPDESILGAGLWQRLLQLGALITAISLGVGWWAKANDAPWQSCLFLALAAAQLGVAVGVRARPGTWQNPFLLWAVAAAYVLQVLAVSIAPLQALLGTGSLTVSQVALVSAVSALGYVAARLQILVAGRRSTVPVETTS
ncbi:MAG: cation-transporting P-type ATPase [Lapillicoccus sp.]